MRAVRGVQRLTSVARRTTSLQVVLQRGVVVVEVHLVQMREVLLCGV